MIHVMDRGKVGGWGHFAITGSAPGLEEIQPLPTHHSLLPADMTTRMIPGLAEVHRSGDGRMGILIIGCLGGVVRHTHRIDFLAAAVRRNGGGAGVRGQLQLLQVVRHVLLTQEPFR